MEHPVLDKLLLEMSKDKWHVKLMRRIRLQLWIARCNLRKQKKICMSRDDYYNREKLFEHK